MTVIVRRVGDWLSAEVGDEMVMMSVEKGNYVGLSEIGTRIWELIATPQDLDALCSQLVGEFEVSAEQCRADVMAFLKELEQHGAIAFDNVP